MAHTQYTLKKDQRQLLFVHPFWLRTLPLFKILIGYSFSPSVTLFLSLYASWPNNAIQICRFYFLLLIGEIKTCSLGIHFFNYYFVLTFTINFISIGGFFHFSFLFYNVIIFLVIYIDVFLCYCYFMCFNFFRNDLTFN